MKKAILLLIPALMLAGCTNDNDRDFKIVCPTGAPAYAFYNYANKSNFETNSVPSNIVAMMSSASDKDVVIIDTVSGIKAINNGAPFKLAASITFGNFYIAATGNDDNGVMDAGDKIVLFGEHQTPDLLFHYLYGDTYDAGIEFVTNVQDAAKCLISGKNQVTSSTVDYVFVAQPVLFNALQKNEKASQYVNVQEAYKEKSGGKSLVQASIFVKETIKEKNSLYRLLDSIEKDINDAVANPDLIADGLKDLSQEEVTAKYGVASQVAVAVMKNNNGLGLGFKAGIEIKDEIDSFISLFSLENTNEEIYSF